MALWYAEIAVAVFLKVRATSFVSLLVMLVPFALLAGFVFPFVREC
jgi:hypothetical protein